jgi:hypothetical protein
VGASSATQRYRSGVDDELRLLAKASERGYVSYSAAALPGEPEAVPADYQQQLSLAARRREQEQRREAWRRAHNGISDAVEEFERDGRPDQQLRSDLRVIRRGVARIDRRLGIG